MLKWFYDTSTSAATGPTCCGSFIGEGFAFLVASYGWTRWTQRFLWFRPSERNTLRLWENWIVLLKHAPPEPAYLSAPVKWRMLEPFIAQGWAVTMGPEARQVASGHVKPYVVGPNG
jgi:hypothetical protein